MTDKKEPGTNYHLDAGGYLSQHGDQAMTKAEHDAYVEKRGRPATDPGYLRRHSNGVGKNGATVTVRGGE